MFKSENTAWRESWGKSIDFIFSAFGYSVGLGNLWRFPYLCFENGGGAFLVPYILFTVVFSVPMIVLETSFGQFFHDGVMKTWARIPLFKGLGIAQFVSHLYGNASYMVILAWIMKYMISSLSSKMLWSTCDNPWNTDNCVQYMTSGNITHNVTLPGSAISAAEEFWTNEVLGKSSSIEEVGSLRLDLVLYLLVLWLVVYLTTFKGIKWSSKVIYVTSTLPIILIVVVLVRGCTLDGAVNGIYYYLYPDIQKLANVKVWLAAASQVAYSVGVGTGILILLGSYNKPNQNFFKDAIIVAGLDVFMSFISGFAVFSCLGFMAKKLNTSMEEVASSGPGLVFIAYPQSISLLPFPQLWGFIFFLTLLFLGLDSSIVNIEYLVNYFIDQSRYLRSFRWHRPILDALICAFHFLFCLVLVSEGGIYVFQMFNHYGTAGWCQFLMCFCELVAIAWLYGVDIHFDQMEKMIGQFRGKMWLRFIWKFSTPVICVVLVVFILAGFKPLHLGSYSYPVWAQCLAHLISLSSVIFIPGYAVYIKLTSGKSFAQLRRKLRNDTKDLKHNVEEVPLENVEC